MSISAPSFTSSDVRPPLAVSSDQSALAWKVNQRSAGLDLLFSKEHISFTKTDFTLSSFPIEEKFRASADLPLSNLPPRYEREVVLPVPSDFDWPFFTFIAFFEHSGEDCEAQAAIRGTPCCSVADRRRILTTSALTWHFIGSVQDFLDAYPHSIPCQYSHPTCGLSNWASWKSWPAKILDGSLLSAAEEFLFMLCIGDTALVEQPPSALQHIIGPPTCTTLGHEHAAPDKTYCYWLRNLPPISPSHVLTPDERWSELSASGDAERKMLLRSYTPRNVARVLAASHYHTCPTDTSDFGRPANAPCREYAFWRSLMHEAFTIFKSHYAPRLSLDDIALEEGTQDLARIFLIPVARSSIGPCFLIPSNTDQACFGYRCKLGSSSEKSITPFAQFLDGGIGTHFAAYCSSLHCDAVVLLPHKDEPSSVAASPLEFASLRRTGRAAVWSTLEALRSSPASAAFEIAAMRLSSMQGSGLHGGLAIGKWLQPKPLIRRRSAREWADQRADDDIVSSARWSAFLTEEERRGVEMRAEMIKADSGDGELISIANTMRTAADFASELPVLKACFPDFDDARLDLLRFLRPLPLSTDWLVRLPAQPCPPGFRPRRFDEIFRGWARRKICHAIDMTIDRDFDDWENGSSSLPRPPYLCLGLGAGKQIKHADGIGSYNALTLIYELNESTGLYGLLDFTKPHRTHWVLDYMRQIFGDIEDKFLLSMIFDGVRWGINPPRQMRIAPQLERMNGRSQKVGVAFAKLLFKSKLYKRFIKLRKKGENLNPNTATGPTVFIPTYVVGCGGTDKPDNPEEARIVGDQSAPHEGSDIRERNKPHGPADGPLAISMNDMMAPAPGKFPRGSRLPEGWPMRDHETKCRPRWVYNNSAILRRMALVASSYLVSVKDDGRHMFFQFMMAPEEEWTGSFIAIVPIPIFNDDGSPSLDDHGRQKSEDWAVNIPCTCMNMGSRNASKIAQCFANEWIRAWARILDEYVEKEWLPTQPAELQQLLQLRKHALGDEQARPFDALGYTDDFEFQYVGPVLAAAGTRIWRDMNLKANFWLSPKSNAGTVLDFIGGRLVLNGGFGCLPPAKRARAVLNTDLTLEGKMTRDGLESHNSFLVHAADWLDWPLGSLKGLSAPLKIPGLPDQLAKIEGFQPRFERVRSLLDSHQAASFWSGVDDVAVAEEQSGEDFASICFAPIFTSDACSDVPHPFICGCAAGLFWRFPLVGEWRNRHITLTEACGAVINLMVFPRFFPRQEIIEASDASAALAVLEGSAASPNLLYLRHRAMQESQFSEVLLRTWAAHVKGWGNGLSDAGSRDMLHKMRTLAQIFGLRLTEVPLPDSVHHFMKDVLLNTDSQPLLPKEMFGRGRVPSCVDFDGASIRAATPSPEEIRRNTRDSHVFPDSDRHKILQIQQAQSSFYLPHHTGSSAASCSFLQEDCASPDHFLRRSASARPDRSAVAADSPAARHFSTARSSPRLKGLPASIEVEDQLLKSSASARDCSPQPRTAKEAIATAGNAVANDLAHDQSAYALSFQDPELMFNMISEINAAEAAGVPKGTENANTWGFKWAVKFGEATGNRWMRPREAPSALDVTREQYFVALFLLWLTQNMSASTRRQQQGYQQAKPTSALLALYGFLRVMGRCRRYVPDLRLVRRVLKGICEKYKQLWGQDSLVPFRKQPFSRQQLLKLIAFLTAFRMNGWSSALHYAFIVLIAFCLSTGTRKDEWVGSSKDYLRRSNFCWVDEDGKDLPSTPDVLASRRNGCMLRGRSAPSKCDRLNVEWGAKDQWFRFDNTNPFNFAYRWWQWEIHFPCPSNQRHEWAAFSPDGSARPFSSGQADTLLHDLLVCVLGVAATAVLSWHAFRVTIAMALLKCRGREIQRDEIDGVIQTLVRWKTLEAMRIYARMAPSDYADFVDLATQKDASLANAQDLPDIDSVEVLSDLEQAQAALDELDATNKRNATSGASDRQAGTSKRPRQSAVAASPARSGDDSSPPTAFTFDDGVEAYDKGPESWGVVGQSVDVDNSFWGLTSGEVSRCSVVGFIGEWTFAEGHISRYTFVISSQDHEYPIRHSSLRNCLVDKSLRRRLRSAPPPRVL